MTVGEFKRWLSDSGVGDDAVLAIERNDIFKEATYVFSVRSPRWVDKSGEPKYDGWLVTLQHVPARQ